jgi:hypothetical protein
MECQGSQNYYQGRGREQVSEYIPTTEEVRQGFADNSFTFMSHEGVTIQVATKWFDHWLEQHDAEVAKVTEQRIIRLLQEPYWHNLRSPGTHEDCKMCETIWLINDRNIL